MSRSRKPKAFLEWCRRKDKHYMSLQGPEGNRLFTTNEFASQGGLEAAFDLMSVPKNRRIELAEEAPFRFGLLTSDDKPLGQSIVFDSKEAMEEAAEQLERSIDHLRRSRTQRKKSSSPPRYAFQLTFYEKEGNWAGKIEYPYRKDRSGLQGFDPVAIRKFLEKHLPTSFSGKRTEENEKIPAETSKTKAVPINGGPAADSPNEQIELQILDSEGKPAGPAISKSCPDTRASIRLRTGAQRSSSGNLHTGTVIAYSLDQRREWQVGLLRNPEIKEGECRMPVQLGSLPSGLYRIKACLEGTDTGHGDYRKATGTQLLRLLD